MTNDRCRACIDDSPAVVNRDETVLLCQRHFNLFLNRYFLSDNEPPCNARLITSPQRGGTA